MVLTKRCTTCRGAARGVTEAVSIVALATAFMAGCSDTKPADTVPQPTVTATVTTTAVTSAAVPPAPLPVDFVAGTPAVPPDKTPTIAFKSPTKDQLIASDKVADTVIQIDLKDWDIPAGGNHVHLILDNTPYKRIDDVAGPIKLGELAKDGLTEGQHVLVAFPSRHTHESVKPVGASVPLAVVTFFVGKKKGEATWKPTDPTFIFSRPKGANNGPPPADGILVDFYLANAPLGDGKFSIEAILSGPGLDAPKKVTIKDWAPWRIKNPRDGSYKLEMTLLDKDGKAVPGAWNHTTREFTVDTKAEPDHTHPAPPAGSSAPSASAAPSSKPKP
ncbi:MAG: hypothetical protein U0414_15640 [Polyangiaceae bacterium]